MLEQVLPDVSAAVAATVAASSVVAELVDVWVGVASWFK